MHRVIVAASVLAAVGLLALARAEPAQPADAERLAQAAKDFGMTPDQLAAFVRRELGDPLLVDGDLIVGAKRDAAGRVTAVTVTTPQRNLAFERQPDERRPGLRYSGPLTEKFNEFTNADDLNGDGRLDMLMLPQPGATSSAILLRIGSRFEPATGLGDRRSRVTSTGETVRFDAARGNGRRRRSRARGPRGS